LKTPIATHLGIINFKFHLLAKLCQQGKGWQPSPKEKISVN
jgi:hypothetical protein